jgi:hypothetical protein
MEEKILTAFFKDVETIKNIPNEDLTRSKQTENGFIEFSILSSIIEIKDMLTSIDKDAFKLLPEGRFNRFKEIFNSICSMVNYLRDTQKGQNVNVQHIKNTVENFFSIDTHSRDFFFGNNRNEMWNTISLSISLKNENYLRIESKIDLNERLQSQISEAEANVTKVNKLVEDAQEIVTKGGIEKHAKTFQVQADTHYNNSQKWRNISLGILLFLICGLITSFCFVIKSTPIIEKIQIGVFTAFTGSLLSYGLSLSVKNFFAEKHNETINKHKANCLSTFTAFTDSTDGKTKEAILLQATQTIFSHQSPGFLAKGTELNNPNPIIDILKNFKS